MAGVSIFSRHQVRRFIGLSLRYVAMGICVLAAAVFSPLKLGVVAGRSMSPSLQDRSFYLLDRTYFRAASLKRNDVVVFRRDGMNYIKRVIGVPGDTIYTLRYQDSDQDELVMDWQLDLVRRAVSRHPWKNTVRLVETHLGPDEYFVVGDNLTESRDSRAFGPITASSIQGRMLFAPAPRPEMLHLARANGRPSKS